MKNDITVGDLVEEVGTDSGWWVVTEVFRNTHRKYIVCEDAAGRPVRMVTEVFRNTLREGFAAKLSLKDRPDCVTFVPIDRLAKVG
jgi:hypothetical protein